MKKLIIHLLIGYLSIIYFEIAAQSTTITPGNSQPNINASSSNAGILVPKVLLTGLASASPVVSPTEGLLVYNISAALPKGFYYWNGSSWSSLGGASATITASSPLSVSTNNVQINAGTVSGQLISWNGTNWVNTNPKPATSISNMQPYLALNYCIALFGIYPARNSADPFVGEIELFAFNFEPNGYAFCNGQVLSIANNSALFSLLGTNYGGNGVNTFNLPDLRGRTPIHFGAGPGLSVRYLGESGGSEVNTINDKY